MEVFPDAPYHVGDLLSIRVSYTGLKDIKEKEIKLALFGDPDEILETVTFSKHSHEAIFYWVLDTTGFQPGFVAFIFSMPELNQTWTSGVHLLPTPPNRSAEWLTVDTACCQIHYISGSDAASEIISIQKILEAQTTQAIEQFESEIDPAENPLEDPLSLVLIPIVVGHGGFATDTAVLTYSQRNWAGIAFEILSHHEIVHVLDRQLNQGPRPSLFSEGIAVYLSGGHYHEGDPLQRAAALVDLGLYLPLADFTDDFYAAQHEISYMQAAGLVAYLSNLWGWETFLDFYFNLPKGDSNFDLISSALESQFGISLAELEGNYIEYLSGLTLDEKVKNDVRLTIQVYDMIRRYQSLAIPSAHFQTAWWPPIDTMLENGIIGDYAFREKTPFNVIIESLFLEIHAALNAQDYRRVEENLLSIDRFLDAIESPARNPSHYAIGWPLPGLVSSPVGP